MVTEEEVDDAASETAATLDRMLAKLVRVEGRARVRDPYLGRERRVTVGRTAQVRADRLEALAERRTHDGDNGGG